jgi:hypothetical protein
MKTFEMEDQLRIIDARTLRIEQVMVTKDDLVVTKNDLKAEIELAVQAMQHEMAGLAARTDRIEVRLATTATKQQLDEAVSKLATKEEMKQQFANVATKGDIRALSNQIAALKPRGRRG